MLGRLPSDRQGTVPWISQWSAMHITRIQERTSVGLRSTFEELSHPEMYAYSRCARM